MITTIIFDWGGILTKGKHSYSVAASIANRYGPDLDATLRLIDEQIDLLDLGSISFRDLLSNVNEKLKIDITEEDMLKIFCKSVIPNKEMIELSKKLKKRYKVILLSNNNEVTLRCLRKNYAYMLEPFEKKYFSSELKMIKPNKDIYEYVLRDFGVKAEECVFIDDKGPNIRVSEELGLNSILFKDNEQVKEGLRRLNIDI